MKTMFSILGGFITAILVIAIALCISVNSLIEQYGNNYIVSEKNAPHVDAIIIPGAKVNIDGTPSSSLKNRLDKGFDLYKQGCAKKILLSGDHTSDYYDEVNVMREYLEMKGVAPQDIFLDHAGIDTYHTMYRANKLFEISNAIVVSQHYHNVRAIYIGRQLGITVLAVNAADTDNVATTKKMDIREYGARFKAFIQAGIIKPQPEITEEPISIFSDGTITHNQS